MELNVPPPDFLKHYYSSRDWVEDFNEENGKYYNNCHFCEKVFIGHKRRVICKECNCKLGKNL